VCNFT